MAIAIISISVWLAIAFSDSYGESVPIMQAFSENLIKDTAEVMVNVLKDLEPEASSKSKILVSDPSCCSAFIHAMALILQPKVLITLDLHETQTRRYNNIIRTMFAPCSHRLDQLCYALFKANDLFDRRNVRQRLEMNLQHSFSHIYETFVSFHPESPLDKDVVVTTLKDGSWEIKDPGQPDSWKVSRSSVGYICYENACQLRCPHCPEGVTCAHGLVCTCDTFVDRNTCPHLHLVMMLNDTALKVEPESDDDYDKLKTATLERLHVIMSKLKDSKASEENFDLCKTLLQSLVKVETSEKEIKKTEKALKICRKRPPAGPSESVQGKKVKLEGIGAIGMWKKHSTQSFGYRLRDF